MFPSADTRNTYKTNLLIGKLFIAHRQGLSIIARDHQIYFVGPASLVRDFISNNFYKQPNISRLDHSQEQYVCCSGPHMYLGPNYLTL